MCTKSYAYVPIGCVYMISVCLKEYVIAIRINSRLNPDYDPNTDGGINRNRGRGGREGRARNKDGYKKYLFSNELGK